MVATGYYDLANQLGIPGEDLPKVFHYYREPHPYFDMRRGGDWGKEFRGDFGTRSVAARGARDPGASRAEMHHHVKYWILPDIENRIKNGEIKAYFSSRVEEIEADRLCSILPKVLYA